MWQQSFAIALRERRREKMKQKQRMKNEQWNQRPKCKEQKESDVKTRVESSAS